MARDQYEYDIGGKLVDRYGRREYVLVDKHLALTPTDVDRGYEPCDADGREQIVVTNAARTDGPVLYMPTPSGDTTGAADLAALAALIAELPSGHGAIELRDGDYYINGTASFDTKISVALRGQGGKSAGSPAATRLIYTAATGSAVSARSTLSFRLQGIQLLYTSATYTGTLLDLSATGTKGSTSGRGTNTALALVDDCYLGCANTVNRSAGAELVNLDCATSSELRDSAFEDANYAITGTSGASTFSDVHHISHCKFANMITRSIHNPYLGWVIDGQCTFEPLASGAPDGVLLDSGFTTSGLTFADNSILDALAAGAAIDLQGTVQSAIIRGNTIGCGPTASTGSCVRTGGTVRLLVIEGNVLSGSYGYDTNGGATLESRIMHNNMISLTAGWSSAAYNSAAPHSSTGHGGIWGFNYGNSAAGDLDSWRPPSGAFHLYGDVIMSPETALATTAVAGFPMIPTCAGAPTGTPTNAQTYQAPLVYDTTNKKLWIYDAGSTAWKGIVVA